MIVIVLLLLILETETGPRLVSIKVNYRVQLSLLYCGPNFLRGIGLLPAACRLQLRTVQGVCVCVRQLKLVWMNRRVDRIE